MEASSESRSEAGPIRISVGAVLESKLGPERSARIPRWVVRRLERIVRQDRLNELLAAAWPRRGADFCRAVLKDLHVEVDLQGRENLPGSGRAIFVCNHPLGGLDGIAIIAALSEVYGDEELHFVVNDMLMAVEPLRDVFVPVNKHGAQSKAGARALEDALEGPGPVVIFPAGLCSRRGKGGRITDLDWRKTFVGLARRRGCPIVPLYFSGRNSGFFYRLASLRERVGIKLNIEMVRLPAELVRAEGSRFQLSCGRPFNAEEIAGESSAAAVVERVRRAVYDMEHATAHK